MAKIIIKYFGKDEYAPLEEILDPQNISSYDLSEFQPPVSDLFYILDDFIIRKSMVYKSKTALKNNEELFTMQQIRKKFKIRHGKNSWLTVWSVWRNFENEIESKHRLYTKSELDNLLRNPDLILVFSNYYFSKIKQGGIPQCGLDTGLPDSVYSLIDICNQILNKTYDSKINKDTAVNSIWELFFSSPEYDNNSNDNYIPDDNTNYIPDDDADSTFTIIDKDDAESSINSTHRCHIKRTKYTTEQILEIFNATKKACIKKYLNKCKKLKFKKIPKSPECVVVIDYMAPIIAAMIQYSHKFPLISYFENSSEIDIEKMPLEPDDFIFQNIKPKHKNLVEYIFWLHHTLYTDRQIYDSLYSEENLQNSFFEFAYWIISSINQHKSDSDNKYSKEMLYYNIEKLFGFHFIQYVSYLTYSALYEEVYNNASLDIHTLLSKIINNNFEKLIKEIYNGYGVYSRLRVAREFIPKFIKETITYIGTSYEFGSFVPKPFMLKDIKKMNVFFKKAEKDLSIAHMHINYILDEKNNDGNKTDEQFFKTYETYSVVKFYNNISNTVSEELKNVGLSPKGEQKPISKSRINKIAKNAYKEWIELCHDEICAKYNITCKEDDVLNDLLFWATTAVITAKKNF